MKKILSLSLALIVIVICIGACSEKDAASELMDRCISSLEQNGFTSSQEYTSEQIVAIEVDFKINPLHSLENTIYRIHHLIKPLEANAFEYVYIYLFETAEDAMSIYESYATPASEYARVSDRVLIFGSSAQINQLEL